MSPQRIDPLLFIAGMIVSNMTLSPGAELPTLLSWILLISLSAVLGNFLGYWCGKVFGNRIMGMKDTWFFKRHYIVKAQEFYEKRGGGAIVLARFLPVVRTFAPIVAGIVNMDFKKFVIYNILGAVIWAGSLMTLKRVSQNNLSKFPGQCGSCWTFAVTAALESHLAIKTQKHQLFSEQQLLDCVTNNYGCTGGYLDTAYQYMGWYGQVNEGAYPYTAKQGTCNIPNGERQKIQGYYDIAGGEINLASFIAEKGPASFCKLIFI